MEQAYSLHGDRLPALPEDAPNIGLPPSPMAPGMQFGMNGGARPASGIPNFYIQAVRKADRTYANVEMVRIITPGDPKAEPVRKVTDGIRAKYRDYYEHWKRTQQMAPIGAPLEMWPMMTPAMVAQLKAANIFTVEQLAEVNDGNLHHIPFGKTIREQAREWLKAKEKSDAIEQATAQTQAMQDGMRMMEERFEAKEAAMRSENADLKAKLDAILTRLSAPEPAVTPPAAEARRGPGRPPKAEAA